MYIYLICVLVNLSKGDCKSEILFASLASNTTITTLCCSGILNTSECVVMMFLQLSTGDFDMTSICAPLHNNKTISCLELRPMFWYEDQSAIIQLLRVNKKITRLKLGGRDKGI